MHFFRRGEVLAALDLGTTNCRLLIARNGGDRLRIIDSFSRLVRLGEGLEASGRLGEAAMRRTLDALAICAAKIDARGVEKARLVATEACRRAANCGAFLDLVEQETGLGLEIISTVEEARLALAGCAPLLDGRRPHALVFDIGGGSTEVMWVDTSPCCNGDAPEILGIVSLPFGVVSLTERFQHQPPTPRVYAEMLDSVRDALAEFDSVWNIAQHVREGSVQMLGSSGTVTTLTGIRLGLPRYDRQRVDGAYLEFGDIRQISRKLVTMTADERAGEPCIGAGRADLMVAGCAILEAICKTWPVGRLRVADRGVREGILAGLMTATRVSVSNACVPAAVLPT